MIERETNGHIVVASNDGLEAAVGEFIVLLDHDDLLTPDALTRNAEVIAEHEDVDYIYSDEDKLDDEGTSLRRVPQARVVARAAARPDVHQSLVGAARLPGPRGRRLPRGLPGIAGPRPRAPGHREVPPDRAHPRGALPLADHPRLRGRDVRRQAVRRDRRPKAVQDHFDRLGLPAEVTHGVAPGLYVARRPLDPSVSVSIVIPTNGSSGMVWGRRRVFVVEAVQSALAATRARGRRGGRGARHPTPPEVLTALEEVAGDRLTLVPFTEPFNFSRKMNLGVLHATGDRSSCSTTTSRRSPTAGSSSSWARSTSPTWA